MDLKQLFQIFYKLRSYRKRKRNGPSFQKKKKKKHVDFPYTDDYRNILRLRAMFFNDEEH